MISKLFLTIPHGYRLTGCRVAGAAGAAGLVGRVCVFAPLVRTERKSLARVLTPIALDLSLSVSLCPLQCMLRCRSCALLLPSVCMGVAESATVDWPQVLCVRVV